MRSRRRGGVGAVAGSGPVSSVTVVGGLNDIATATLAPAVTNGQSIPLDSAGWVLLIQCSGAQTIADATKMTVNITRPGHTSGLGDAPTTRTDTALGIKVLRRAFPNQASALPAAANAFYVAIDNVIHGSDSISSITLAAGFFTGQTTPIPIGAGLVTNSSGLAYVKPIVKPASLPFRRYTTSATVEFAAISEWAAFGSQVARVEARAKIGSNYGPWAASGTMVRSASTPASGRFPSGIPVPVYSVTVDLVTGLSADSASRTDSMIVYRAYGWTGDVLFDSETDGMALNAAGLPTGDGPPVGLPFIKDVAERHTPIYAWVNRDGTAGASAAIQTGTTDPGSAGSYASENAAMTAARSWNNNSTNRPGGIHNTTSGLVILYRDVAGGSLGNSNLAYWQRATMSGFSDGLLPPVLCSAAYLSSGTTTLNCRRRGVQDNGTTAATSKVYNGIFEFRGITFDSIGLTSASHQILDGQTTGGATTAATATTGTILIDVDIREASGAGSTVAAISRPGWRWDVRVDQGGLNAGEGATGVTSLGAASAAFAGLQMSIGSLYSRGATASSAYLPYTNLLGVWARNIFVQTNPVGIKPPVENGIMYHVRIDLDAPAAVSGVMVNTKIALGIGMCGVLVRRTGSQTSPAFRLSADGARLEINNCVVQHISADSGLFDDQDRTNFGYNDQGWIYSQKRVSAKYCAFGSYNIKDDIFAAPELVGNTGNADGPWTASTQVWRGTIFHDGNATPANRVFYQAIVDFVTGTVQATDLADTSRWLNAGLVNSVAFGAQPLRTGNWRAQHGVRQFGNVAAKNANGDAVTSPGSWYGEAWGRGGAINATWANYFKTRTGGALASFTTWGDYRPQSTAAGDANDSPLLNRVPAGSAVSPFDLSGVTRLNDGSGAAGAYERSA